MAGAQRWKLHSASKCSLNALFVLSVLAFVFHLSLSVSSLCSLLWCGKLQVLGLFTVGATATGCMDTTNVASPTGLDAVGVLLLLLSILYVIAMALLVLVTGAHKTKRFTQAAVRSFQSGASNFGRSMCTSFARLRSARGSGSGRLGIGPVPGTYKLVSNSMYEWQKKQNSVSGSVNKSGSSSICQHQRSRAGELNRGSSMQLSLLPPATDSSMTPLVTPADVDILQSTKHDTNIRNRLPVLSVHEHSVWCI